MAKGIFDIIGDIAETVASDPDNPMAEMAGSIQEMEELLESLTKTNPEAAERLAPLLEQAKAMNGMMDEIVAAEAAGDTEAMYELSQGFAALADVPGYEPETDPEYTALSDALDEDGDEALGAVLDTLGDLNRHLGKYNQTPLGMALSAPGRSVERVRMFLDRGARADFATPEGYTPLHSIGDYMRTGDTPDTLDELAAIVETLVSAGADIEARTHWGWTPLVRAALEGSALEMRALLAAGADPNARVGDEGPGVAADKSLLMMVAAEPDKVALLLDYGADVVASGVEEYIEQELATEDPNGYTAFWDSLRASKTLIESARRQ